MPPFLGKRMYETFEHTADLGLRAWGPDLSTAFADVAAALFSTVLENLDSVRQTQRVEISISGEDREYLLFDWLKELLYRFDGEHLVFGRFDVQVSDAGLTATVWGEPLDESRHVLGHEVKAITYHALKVEPTADGWLVEVIVDI